MSARGGTSSIKSAVRTMALIEYFNQRRSPASINDICAALGIPQSSASMLVKCMTDLGYLSRLEGTRTYVPGSRSAFLGDWALERLGQFNPLCQVAAELAFDLGQTAVVGTQNGPYVQYLHVVSARDMSTVNPHVGKKTIMACTAAGRSLLSRLESQKIIGIARRNNAEAPPHARISERRLLETIEIERSLGYCESRGGLVAGINSISVLLGRQGTGTPLVIGVGGAAEPMMRIREEVIARLMTIHERLNMITALPVGGAGSGPH